MVKSYRELPIGTKIEMTVIDPLKGNIDIGFISQIEDFAEENVLKISAPIFRTEIYPISTNSKIEAFLFYKSSIVYKIVGYVINRTVVDNIALLELKVTEDITRIQRREFFRFECNVPIAIFLDEQANIMQGRTLDISGGGLSCITSKGMQIDSNINGRIYLDDNALEFSGKVIRSNENIINDSINYISSINFSNLSGKDREKIIAFIFNNQRTLLKRGLKS
jgi:c-di-GMP-binding flagellar brake protein YcgR